MRPSWLATMMAVPDWASAHSRGRMLAVVLRPSAGGFVGDEDGGIRDQGP